MLLHRYGGPSPEKPGRGDFSLDLRRPCYTNPVTELDPAALFCLRQHVVSCRSRSIQARRFQPFRL